MNNKTKIIISIHSLKTCGLTNYCLKAVSNKYQVFHWLNKCKQISHVAS